MECPANRGISIGTLSVPSQAMCFIIWAVSELVFCCCCFHLGHMHKKAAMHHGPPASVQAQGNTSTSWGWGEGTLPGKPFN